MPEEHSASETTLAATYKSSLANLERVVLEMDVLWVYDNSALGGPPRLVLESEKGVVRFLTGRPSYVARIRDRAILNKPYGSTTTGARQKLNFCALGSNTLTWHSYLPG